MKENPEMISEYTDDNIKTLEWNKHIRQRAGMYIGNLGGGTNPGDGIYILLKEIIDNSIDEFSSGFGKQINVTIDGRKVTVRDFGRGIPLDSVVKATSNLNTGAKFDSKAFKKSVGLNGVGTKAVNALSEHFYIESFRDGESSFAEYSRGELINSGKKTGVKEKNGTFVEYTADTELFGDFAYKTEFVENTLKNYSYLKRGLTLTLNGTSYSSKNGLLDLINENMSEEPLYPPIHLQGEDIEVVITHNNSYGENIASFVNGQNTRDGGTHLAAFREAVAKTLKEFYKKDYAPEDIRQGIVGAISIGIQEPKFESQTKIKLGSIYMWEEPVKDEPILTTTFTSTRTSLPPFRKKSSIPNRNARRFPESRRNPRNGARKPASTTGNCATAAYITMTSSKQELAEKSSIFITEGDSASGTITQARNATTQAVFSLRGKPLNCYKVSRKKVAENEEFTLLVNALGIEDDMADLRYNNIIVATDADDDGMHIRMLVLTFFLKYYPDLVRRGHVYILQTPLFRVRNKKDIRYCYSIEERDKAVKALKNNVQITRFKGLGEISDKEFREFIGDNIRLDTVSLGDEESIAELLEFYMGDNTIDRQNFIRQHLKSEEELEDINL